MGVPTRFPGGIAAGARRTGIFWNVPLMDPRQWHYYWNDFDTFEAADWTATETQSSATEALTDGDGGVLLLTNSAADDDAVSLQKISGSFLLVTGKPLLFAVRFKVSDATQSDLQLGLVVTDTTPLDATDGIYFQKDDGAATVDLYVRKNATTGSNKTAAIAPLVDDTWIELAWMYDGVETVYYYVNDRLAGSMNAAAAYLPDTYLTPTLTLQNGEAAAKTMSVDYFLVAKKR